jgi:hypothetical protein
LNGSRKVLIITFVAALVGAAGWAQSAHGVVVPIQGEYYDSAAGGLLVYNGTITLDWPSLQDSPQAEPVSGSLVATAWSKTTGAGYTLYGYYADLFAGATGSTLELSKTVVGIGSGMKPEFESTIRVKLSMFSREVQQVAFAGR